jgi:serine/threonine-protein kinase HipA
MGALRFKEELSGPFLNNDKELASPPWTTLRELEKTSLKLEDDDAVDNPDYMKWLNMLIHPGSSLGGARPKAGVEDDAGHLWIAKFPSKHDVVDIGGWEMVANILAIKSGIRVPQTKIEKLSTRHHTFMSKRFDRANSDTRVHFASAMTLLGYSDGADFHSGASYLDIAEFIMKNGADVKGDLEELWRRIVFSIAIANSDDHLRNHGFLLTNDGWRLSPAYDINPVSHSNGLTLNISENDNALDFQLALQVREYFRIKKVRAEEIIDTVKTAVSGWMITAKRLQIPRNEQEIMANAFKAVK